MSPGGSHTGRFAEQVVVRPLRSENAVELSDLLKIYEEAIPASERKPPEAVRRMLESANYRVLGAFAENRLIGFLIAYTFDRQPLSLLEYMAVDKAWQGCGVGGRLFRELVASTNVPEPLLLEVDSDHASSPDREQRSARKRFYRRLGCREVDGLTYQLPLPGDPPVMDLLVYWQGQRQVTRALIKEWLTTIYTDVYGQSESDPRIQEMIGSLPEEVGLV